MAQQILIDKLLQACVKQGASDIHITVGQPPVFRLHGRLRKLETKVLESEDTVSAARREVRSPGRERPVMRSSSWICILPITIISRPMG